MTADNLKPDSRIMSMLVGESGTGKSCAAAFFPKPIKWIAVTNRYAGILGHPEIRGQEWLKKIDIEKFSLRGGFSEIDKRLEQLLNDSASPSKFPWKTIVFEDFTACSDLLLADAFKWTSLLKDNTGKPISWHKQLGPVDIAGLDEFAYEDQAFKDICLAISTFPCHVLVMTHWTDKYENNKVTGKKISLRNATIPKVLKWFNEVWYFDKAVKPFFEKGERHERINFTCQFRGELARTVFPDLPDQIDWTGKDFFQEITKYAKEIEHGD